MTCCTKCDKPTNNGIMCKDCIILDSPWLLAMKSKEDDLIEQIEQLKAENAALKERLKKAVELPCIEPMTTWEWDDEKGIEEEHFGDYYQLLYRDKDGEFICTLGFEKEEAKARLKELKGENQSAEEGKSETET